MPEYFRDSSRASSRMFAANAGNGAERGRRARRDFSGTRVTNERDSRRRDFLNRTVCATRVRAVLLRRFASACYASGAKCSSAAGPTPGTTSECGPFPGAGVASNRIHRVSESLLIYPTGRYSPVSSIAIVDL